MNFSSINELEEALQMPPRLADSYEVLAAVLQSGLNVLLLPRQVTLAAYGEPVPAAVSFAHGVPEAATVAAVTFAQDRRLRRALVERVNGRNVRGATFSWRSLGRASRWANRVGYPVQVREMVGENPAETIRGVSNSEELEEAFAQLRVRTELDRTPGKNPHVAGYATTRLTFDVDEEGQEMAPLRSRMLVERDRPGTVTRVFVAGDNIVAAVLLDEAHKTGIEDVTEVLHPEMADMARTAVRAIPGLGCASVDLFDEKKKLSLERIKERLSRPSRTGPSILELSERPRIETYMTANAELGLRIGTALLAYQAAVANLKLEPAESHRRYRVLVEGIRDPHVAQALFCEQALKGKVDCEAGDVVELEGDFEVTLEGAAAGIARLVELLMAGELESLSNTPAAIKLGVAK